MKCGRCEAEGTFQVKDGDQTSWLCATCLDRSFPDVQLGSLTKGFQRKRQSAGCPYCGWTAEKAKDSGLVGCPLCYEALEATLWPEFGIHLVDAVNG